MGRGDSQTTSIKRRLDHVLKELDALNVEPNEKATRNIATELAIIKSAFRETKHSPMCCFDYDRNFKISCDIAGPLAQEEFMGKCRQCQAQIKQTLQALHAD